MKKIAILLVTLLTTLCLFQSSHAATAVPDAISYQGRALTAAGTLMGAGTPVNRTVIFRIWDHASNSLTANLIYSEQQVVTIAEGEFSVLIGTGAATANTPLGYSETAKGPPTVKISDVFGGASRYLGVTIDDGSAAVDNEISPRQQIVSGAFALRSKVAESVDGLAITTAMLANNAVTTTQVNDAAITTSKLAANAVTTAQITNASITSAKIATDTIIAGNIAAGAVGTSEIADLAVTTAKIADGQITSVKIADDTITGADIAAGTITLTNLIAAVQQALVPPGTIVAYGGETAPAGWLLCNGASFSRSTYPSLFTAIGTAFGTASSTVFNVPDFRGRFLRGWDSATARDPDRANRAAMITGGNTGDKVGSIQSDEFRSHAHSMNFNTSGYNVGYNNAQESLGWARNNGIVASSTANSGGNETRPLNANVNYIIKF